MTGAWKRGVPVAFAVWGALGVFAATGASPVAAQEESLDRIEELAGLGRMEEAREQLLAWWENDRSTASRRSVQRGLWLRGRLTVDPGQAELDYQRLAIEYPGGPYTDVALFRLAQSAHARGSQERANRFLGTLARDYRTSPVRDEAAAWFSAAGPAGASRRSESAATAPSRSTESTPTPPVAVAEEPAGSRVIGRADPPPVIRRGPATDPAARGRYSVQLGAFSDRDRAETVAANARAADLEVRLVRVRGSRLVHVRVGRFDSSASAGVFLQDVRGLGFTAAVVRDAQDEEPIG